MMHLCPNEFGCASHGRGTACTAAAHTKRNAGKKKKKNSRKGKSGHEPAKTVAVRAIIIFTE
jgi:hypothetical protein